MLVMPRSDEEDARLLAASASGDQAAFARFYRRHLPAVVAILMRETGDRELSADLAAEVFAAALLASGRYRPQHSSALPWLCGIARFKLSESRRRGRAEDRARARLGIPGEHLEDQDLARVEELADQGSMALDLMDELPAVQRDALWARVIDEREYGDIAERAGISEATVRQRVSRALVRLRTRLEQEQR
jgi:RNA polymerase sigma-70 factor (ECF subfamily)